MRESIFGEYFKKISIGRYGEKREGQKVTYSFHYFKYDVFKLRFQTRIIKILSIDNFIINY